MTVKEFDAAVIGCGAAGMAAALELDRLGFSTAILEREEYAGGILNQCIHNGFGLHAFKEELTGPEYAGRYIDLLEKSNIQLFLDTTVTGIREGEGTKDLICCSAVYAPFLLKTGVLVLAMGCRERNRGNIGTAGTRPAGIFTAGFAQRLLNIDGLVPGRQVVIIGSGDIGLIMARRLSWCGSRVLGVVEIRPYPSGLTRNIVQCLEDFSIPLYLGHVVSGIYGRDRVECVEVTPLTDNKPDYGKQFTLACDTVLLSVGLIPENEISGKAGVIINPDTSGPVVDSHYMTSIPGIFACGNVLHVHDLVDFVSEEAELCGKAAAEYLSGKRDFTVKQLPVNPGANVKYVLPNRIDAGHDTAFLLRPLLVKKEAVLNIKTGNRVIKSRKLKNIHPAEMIRVLLKASELESADRESAAELEIEIQ